ncbi:nuclear transport factor 2 family protein [Actinoplanes aureus]|uniref:Nuclear transport factor 2 family protein n=1 Tax=Actinoplanes aureus TaxID=2792083 RepID=A0A931CBC5_9ACTN|nr:nuclear transport factor 2 family protein [Actinoplanes aureus]MBG0565564.1 nuclear transport factor 2 family protein [Actinoplanes aureus]
MTRLVAALLAVALALAACDPGTPAPATTASSTTEAGGTEVVRSFIEALNRGDGDAARALVAPDARFDSVGRLYPDRQAIFDRFLDPEVIAVGGRYSERGSRTEGDRLVVEYDFTTGSGGRERFTYAYRIDDGLIVDVVGRYV